jgi:hypothetical protein
MKTLVTILIAGALSATSSLAGAIPRNDAGTKRITPQLPMRLYQKRPDGKRTAAGSGALPVKVATPRLPFRPYQKRPVAAPARPTNIANRQAN